MDVAPYATNPNYCINGFEVSGPDAQGYVTLLARSSEGTSTPVFRSRWEGTAVQPFNASGCIVAFQVSGPDGMGYVTLEAMDANGGSRGILRTRWTGSAVQGYTLPGGTVLDAFFIGGPDPMGYVVLSADTVDSGTPVEEDNPDSSPYLFALQRVQIEPGGSIVLSYSIPQTGPVRLTLYNAMGQKVVTLVDATQAAGSHRVSLTTPKLPRGIYFLTFSTPGHHMSRKLLLLAD